MADGDQGVRVIVANLNHWKDFYGIRPEIRAAALAVAGGQFDDDDRGHVDRLARFVRRAVVYVKDPINAEFVQTPDVMLLQIHDTGRAHGDCDDHVLLFAALAESLGIPCTIAGVKSPGATRFDHVIVLAEPAGMEMQVDLCAKQGPAPTYAEILPT